MVWRPVVFDHLKAATSAKVSAELVDYWLATGKLSPELVTGHQLIDFEHSFLISIIADLRRVCKDYTGLGDCISCGEDPQRRCEAQVVGMLGDLFAFILEHFKTEEAVMRDSLLLMVDRDVCQAHMEDHATISSAVHKIVSSLDTQHVVSRIRELDTVLVCWMANHTALHDQLLVRWVSREDSLTKDW